VSDKTLTELNAAKSEKFSLTRFARAEGARPLACATVAAGCTDRPIVLLPCDQGWQRATP
jgi:hypothetical protein